MKHNGLTFILTTFALAAASVTPLRGVSREICIYPHAAISGEIIRLADIANVQEQDAAFLSRLEASEVGVLNPETQTAVIGLYEINRALVRLGVSPASFTIYGARRCVVTSSDSPASTLQPPTTVPTQKDESRAEQEFTDGVTIRELLEEHVAQQTGLPAEALRYEWRTRSAQWLDTRVERDSLDVRPLSTLGLGQVQFKIEFKKENTITAAAENGKRPSGLSFSGDVSYMCQSVVANRTIRAGDVIEPNDVLLQILRIRRLDEQGFRDLNQVVGFEASRLIRPNQVIQAALIRKPQLVKRDSMVEVSAQSGLMQLQFQGRALKDGGLGDWITVRNEQNNTLIQAWVTGPGKAQVKLSKNQNRYAAGENSEGFEN